MSTTTICKSPKKTKEALVPTKAPAKPVQTSRKGELFDFDSAQFAYEPFPIALIKPSLAPAFYAELVDTFPDISLFKEMSSLGNKASRKWSLAEANNGDNYREFLAKTPAWKKFHDWVKSPEFLVQTIEFLNRNNVELGYLRPDANKTDTLLQKLELALRKAKNGHALPLSARFEFSVMPADGGQLHPHTDSPWKIITYVVSMLKPGEWDPAYGGGTDMLRPKQSKDNFNWLNGYREFDQCEVLSTYEFEPNQALIFVKTFNSWHCVKPIQGPPGMLRRTLTINIEKLDKSILP
jgi:hypothetical protein